MGLRGLSVAVMEWQSDLRGMKKHGTRIRASCENKDCRHYWDWPVDDLIKELGSDKASLWDRSPPCERCGEPILFLASPGEGAVFLPLASPRRPGQQLPIESHMDGWTGLRPHHFDGTGARRRR